jgi:GNAT superfamily N-acetyltransferase
MIVPADGELLEEWRVVHNVVVAPAPLSAAEVHQRAERHDLSVAYVDGVLVGNATVRAPEGGGVTLIVRVLPEHRRRGFGGEYLATLLAQVRTARPVRIDTVVLAVNADGLTFARRHGFVETGRYERRGVTYVDLTLRDGFPSAPSTN